MTAELTTEGRMNRIEKDMEKLEEELHELDASADTKRAFADAITTFQKAQMLRRIDKEEEKK